MKRDREELKDFQTDKSRGSQTDNTKRNCGVVGEVVGWRPQDSQLGRVGWEHV